MSAAAKASGVKYTIAVVGATGHLGLPLTTALARDYKPLLFSRVLGLVRNNNSDAAKSLAAQGVELHEIDEDKPVESFTKALHGVDIFLEITPASISEAYKEAIVEGALKNGVKLFFPSEWGRDTTTDYWGWNFAPLARRSEFSARLIERAKVAGMKLVFVYPSYFLDMMFSSPYAGWDHAKNVYWCYGSPTQRISFTDEDDIARAVVELSCLALNSETASSVPERVRIEGDTVSIEGAARIVEKVRGDGRKIEIESRDYNAAKAAVQKELTENYNRMTILQILRLSNADGEADFSHRHNNELVNPGQSLWKWKTVEEYARDKNL